jgi:hypothetical protein
MEVNNQEPWEQHRPVSMTSAEQASLDIIRTETVLSRLPVHNLAKQGRVNIQIIKTTPTGEVELKWEVSYSDRYGQARQLAYKLDTIIINQRIEEAGRPLPRLLRIGSLNDICAELNLATHAGQNSKDLKKAFLQNASAFINAKFNYRANDGAERHVEAGITRYGVIFTGEKLPDGRKADAVYIAFNDPFWEVLNNAPVRPLDRAYMKSLPPAAQRFYEIISRKIFAALKNNYSRAKISYSEYCMFSAQLRHFERQPVQDQMAKVIRHHKTSGYITAVKYESTIDAQNQPDWIMYLTPGPKAHAEFAAAHGKRKLPKAIDADAIEGGDRPRRYRNEPRTRQVEVAPAIPTHDPQLIAEFTRRGITERKTLEILAKVKPGQDVVAQLELGERMVQVARVPITNPPGFLINLIESNMTVPESFETSAKRKAREENEQKERERRAREDARQALEWEYDDYCRAETERFIALNPTTFESVKDAKRTELRDRHQRFSPDMIETMAEGDAYREMQKRMTIPTLKEFADQKKTTPDFFLKPVAVLASAPLVSDVPLTEDTEDMEEIVMTDDAVVAPEEEPMPGSGSEETGPAPEVAMQSTTPIAAFGPEPESAKSEPATDPATPVAGIDAELESAKAEPAPLAVIELGPGTELTNSAPANAAQPAPTPLPPISTPNEGLGQGMEQGLAARGKNGFFQTETFKNAREGR